MPGDTNGGLVYSHLQNSTTAGDILTKLGMLVRDKMLEDRGTCFLSGVSINYVKKRFCSFFDFFLKVFEISRN